MRFPFLNRKRFVFDVFLVGLVIGFLLSKAKDEPGSSPSSKEKERSQGCAGAGAPPATEAASEGTPQSTDPVNRRPHQTQQPSFIRIPVESDSDNAEINSEDSRPTMQEESDRFVFGLDKHGIDEAIRSITDEIQDCYQEGVIEDDLSEGRVLFKFKIEPRTDDPENADIAKITEVGVKDTTIDSARVEACVMDLIDDLWFDPPEEGVFYIQYPITFSDPESD